VNWKKWLLPAGFQSKASAVTKIVVGMLSGEPVWTPKNYAALSKEGYEQNLWVYRCVQVVAQAAAGVDWLVYQKQGKNKKEIEDHDILKLLYKPNEYQSKQEFIENLVAFYLLSGNSYIEKNGPNTGAPKELFALRPDRMKVIPDKMNFVSGYEYSVNGENFRWKADKVMHLKSFHPTNDFYGLSPIEIAARSVDNDNAATAWNNSLLNNGARPTGAMVSDAVLSDPQYKQLKGEIELQYKGAKNAGRPMLLEGGLKWQEMGLSPRDMDFINSKKMSRLEICAAFGVPPEMVGDKEHATYSNYAEARQSFYTETVLPILDKIRDKLNSGLVTDFGENLYLDYDKDSIEALQENTDEKAKRIREDVKAGLIMQNEGRVALGYETTPNGDVFFIPANTMVVDKDNNIVFNPKPSEPEEPEETPEETEGKNRGFFLSIKGFNMETDEQKTLFWKAIDKRRDTYNDKVTKQVARLFESERKQVLNAFKEGGEAAALKVIEANKKEWKKLFTAVNMAVIEDFGNSMFSQLKYQAEQVEVKLGIRDLFNIFATAVQGWITKNVANKVVKVTDTTKKLIKNSISSGEELGESIPEMAARIDKLYLDQIIPNRSVVIARTEIISSSNAGNRLAAEQTGLDLTKEWISTKDDRVRDGHEEANGQQKDFNEPYEVMGESLMFPADPEGSPENVIMCRCSEGYHVKK